MFYYGLAGVIIVVIGALLCYHFSKENDTADHRVSEMIDESEEEEALFNEVQQRVSNPSLKDRVDAQRKSSSQVTHTGNHPRMSGPTGGQQDDSLAYMAVNHVAEVQAAETRNRIINDEMTTDTWKHHSSNHPAHSTVHCDSSSSSSDYSSSSSSNYSSCDSSSSSSSSDCSSSSSSDCGSL